uniref:Type-2 restriction enzyme EcoRII n=1 Tax=Escherichia coli TaxID=562 RepID=A0A899NFD5_ECOLX|nr:hypothetical protein [Escherichia coli]QSM61997.1 Type-2 restriction enzyme EcoRII [Escherichia coli]
MFAGKKSAQIREILISESAWEEMTCLFAPSLGIQYAASHYVKNSLDPDEQLLDRRRVEYDIFLLVEELGTVANSRW